MRLRKIDLNSTQREALETGQKQGGNAKFRQRCQIILLKNRKGCGPASIYPQSSRENAELLWPTFAG